MAEEDDLVAGGHLFEFLQRLVYPLVIEVDEGFVE